MKKEDFEAALKDKKVPILVLDQKWHRLFAIHDKTEEIKHVESQLNSLLAEQGKLNNELKELKKVKKQLMDNIVENMDDAAKGENDKLRTKKLEEDKRLIDDINNKIDEKEDTLLDIPKQINDVNRELMLLSMDYFYGKLRVNQEQAKEIEDWINQVRIDLKKNIIRKQNREINNKEIYSYLHDIFGHDVIELFDVAHDEMIGNKEGQGE